MPRLFAPLASVLIPVSTLGLFTPCIAAPKRDYKEVELRTGDGMELSGRYFMGRAGRESPAVIVLDDIGSGASPDRCDATARELVREGCTVLCFDFRGHGRSTKVATEFWTDPVNRQLVRGYSSTRPKAVIAAADFKGGYLPRLVNDVAAARAYLARRNDAGECNAAQTVVVGFGRGAALGALWVATEWNRYRAVGEYPERLNDAPEGRDIVGCVWVAPDPKLDGRTRPVLDWIRLAEKDRNVAQAWIYDKADRTAAGLATRCSTEWNRDGAKLSVRREMTTTGEGSILSDPTLPSVIARGVQHIRSERAMPEWDDRDFSDNRYLWVFPGWRRVVAKEAGHSEFGAVFLDPAIGR